MCSRLRTHPKPLRRSLYLVLVALYGAIPITASAEPPTTSHRENVLRLRLEGDIDPTMESCVENHLRMNAPASRLMISLRSDGGNIDVAQRIVQHISLFQRRFNIPVEPYLAAQDHCWSACVLIYMVGTHRAAARSASFGFHESWGMKPPRSGFLDALWIGENSGRAVIELGKVGINRSWIEREIEKGTFDSMKMTVYRAEELEGSGIVHQLIPDGSR